MNFSHVTIEHKSDGTYMRVSGMNSTQSLKMCCGYLAPRSWFLIDGPQTIRIGIQLHEHRHSPGLCAQPPLYKFTVNWLASQDKSSTINDATDTTVVGWTTWGDKMGGRAGGRSECMVSGQWSIPQNREGQANVSCVLPTHTTLERPPGIVLSERLQKWNQGMPNSKTFYPQSIRLLSEYLLSTFLGQWLERSIHNTPATNNPTLQINHKVCKQDYFEWALIPLLQSNILQFTPQDVCPRHQQKLWEGQLLSCHCQPLGIP